MDCDISPASRNHDGVPSMKVAIYSTRLIHRLTSVLFSLPHRCVFVTTSNRYTKTGFLFCTWQIGKFPQKDIAKRVTLPLWQAFTTRLYHTQSVFVVKLLDVSFLWQFFPFIRQQTSKTAWANGRTRTANLILTRNLHYHCATSAYPWRSKERRS